MPFRKTQVLRLYIKRLYVDRLQSKANAPDNKEQGSH